MERKEQPSSTTSSMVNLRPLKYNPPQYIEWVTKVQDLDRQNLDNIIYFETITWIPHLARDTW